MSKGLDIKVGRTELTAPNGTTFVHPYKGRGTYSEVMKQIDAAGLKRPTFRDTIVLAHSAWQNPEETYSKEIIELMKNDWLVTDTGLLYLPEEGVYVQDHPENNEQGWIVMNKDNLASRLKDKDPSVRFVPFGYATDEMSSKQLAKNQFVAALAGDKEGAQMAANIADKYSDKPYVWAFSEVSEPQTRAVSLVSDYYGYWLGVDGRILESYWYGCAFGVAQKSEAGAK